MDSAGIESGRCTRCLKLKSGEKSPCCNTAPFSRPNFPVDPKLIWDCSFPLNFHSKMSSEEASSSVDKDGTEAVISELNLPPYRKVIVLGLLCTAIFLDVFNSTALSTALPIISLQLKISNSESVWLYGAYQLTFSASLLVVRLT